jgi:hypothetical protein
MTAGETTTGRIQMRRALAVALGLVALAGCKRGQETGRAGATDTMVTTRQTQDTTLVSHDTTVKVDTTVKRGDKSVGMDTVKKSVRTHRPGTRDTAR